MERQDFDYDKVLAKIKELMKELESSDLVEELKDKEKEDMLSAAHQFMELGCNYCWEGEPNGLGRGEIVREIMLEWVPRKVGGDETYFNAFPSGVILALRFLGQKYGWSNTEKLVAWVESARTEFMKAVNDPRNFGMAKALTMMMQRDGVDITDKKAVDKWIANYNRSRQESPLGLADDDDPLMRQVKNFTPKTGRNAPCPCGSGKKYKKCCGRKIQPVESPQKEIPLSLEIGASELRDNYSEIPISKVYNVPLKEWRALYEVAFQFKKLAPWRWMFEDDIFGVQNPVTGEIGYVSIMGNLGEHLALAVYPGREGLESWRTLRTQAEKPYSGKISKSDVLEEFMSQKCLMASFEDRDYLEKRDRETIRKLGLKFKGAQDWPLFRNYSPGYVPWYLTRDEVKYLTLVLTEAMGLARRFQKDPELLEEPEENQYLVRVPEKEGTSLRPDENQVRWRDEWLKPRPVTKRQIELSIDEARLDRIKNTKYLKHGIWEIDFFFLPTPVTDEAERPFYPYSFLCLERASEFIIGAETAKPWDYVSPFSNKFLECLEDAKGLPSESRVKRERVYQILQPLTERLGIKLTRTKRLPALDKAAAFMLNSLPTK